MLQQTYVTPLLRFEKVSQMPYFISKVSINSKFGRGVILKMYRSLVKQVEKQVIKGQTL